MPITIKYTDYDKNLYEDVEYRLDDDKKADLKIKETSTVVGEETLITKSLQWKFEDSQSAYELEYDMNEIEIRGLLKLLREYLKEIK